MKKKQIKVYLAGPDVFDADPIATGKALKKLCKKAGLVGLYPMDPVIKTKGRTKNQIATDIYRANVELIKQADIIIANVSPFRGISLDVGTAFEIGYATALGKPVFAYSSTQTHYFYRACYQPGTHLIDGRVRDNHGQSIEDFELCDNLMIAMPIIGKLWSTAEYAISAASVYAVAKLGLKKGKKK